MVHFVDKYDDKNHDDIKTALCGTKFDSTLLVDRQQYMPWAIAFQSTGRPRCPVCWDLFNTLETKVA